ncbi:MAG: hypothetical protein Q9160_003532 [Pyrenula sp. 1 TL-2023]
MAPSIEDWSINANDALTVQLTRPTSNGSKPFVSFHPKFTYPIFGEEERIFGYQGLEVTLKFASHDLRPNVQIAYDKVFPPVADTAALDVKKALKDWLPRAFRKPLEYEQDLAQEQRAKEFSPPGTLLQKYSRHNRNFEIWQGSLSDPAVREVFDRIQIFTSLFIEGGTPINTEDVEWTLDRWTIYFTYEVLEESLSSAGSPYVLVGYANTYRFYAFRSLNHSLDTEATSALGIEYPPQKPISISSLPSRLRISQFLILPPSQRMGHGQALYDTIYKIAVTDSTVQELTVEDPNEEFDVLRDTCDHRILFPRFHTVNLKINSSPYSPTQKRPPPRLPTTTLLPQDTLTSIRKELKIAPRQFARLTEMYLLSLIPEQHRLAGNANLSKLKVQKWKVQNENDKAYYWWRMLVKQRIYKKNRDLLIQIDQEERWGRLEDSTQGVEGEYTLLLQSWMESEEGGEDGAGNEGSTTRRATKRKIIDEDDDENEDEENDIERDTNGTVHSKNDQPAKRAKVSD